jgi:hypothetical protein
MSTVLSINGTCGDASKSQFAQRRLRCGQLEAFEWTNVIVSERLSPVRLVHHPQAGRILPTSPASKDLNVPKSRVWMGRGATNYRRLAALNIARGLARSFERRVQ